MTQQQGIVKGDALQKVGSAGFILGAILFGASGFLMPHANTPTGDLQEMLTPLGEHQFLMYVSSLSMVIGFWAALMGIAGVNHSTTASGSAWARLGFYFTLIGTALWTICLSLDVSTASAVANWLSTPIESKETAWGVVAALSAFGRGIIPLTRIVYWLALLPEYWHDSQCRLSALVGMDWVDRERSHDRFGRHSDFHAALDYAHARFFNSHAVDHIVESRNGNLDHATSVVKETIQ